MSVMDKFLNAMKLNDEDDEYYDDYYDDEPEPVKKPGHGGMRDQTHYRGGCQRDHGDASGQQDGGSQP